MKLLCITNPKTPLPTDTTFGIYNLIPADPRFELFHLDAHNVVRAPVLPVTRIAVPLTFPEFQAASSLPVEGAQFADFDLVWSRTDKPFPPGFIDALVRHEQDTRFVTRPSSMLRIDQRAFHRAHAGSFMPPGVVTRSVAEATAFIHSTGSVVAKRNRSYGGKGISRLWRQGGAWMLQQANDVPSEHAELESALGHLFATDAEPYEFVQFQRNVAAGDKRVLVVEGEIYGAFLRLATDGGWIHNISSGGRPLAATVTPRELAVVRATWATYRDHGHRMLGYDFLLGDSGEWVLSEINAGSNVGGFGSLERACGLPVYPRLFDWILDLGAR